MTEQSQLPFPVSKLGGNRGNPALLWIRTESQVSHLAIGQCQLRGASPSWQPALLSVTCLLSPLPPLLQLV